MVTYLRQDPTTNLMSPVSGVQVQPATQGQPVEISASGRIDASLLPTTYDPKIDVVAAEAVQAGDLCYLLWENGTRVIRKAVSTAWSTLSTVFVKESYAQGAAAAAYIHGVMTLVNPGTFTAADVGTSIYLSPTIPGYFQKNYPTATGQFTQRVAVITDVTESTLSCFFIGYLDRGRSAGSGLVDTDPTVTAHLTDLNNPHQVNATQVGAVSTTQVGVASGVAPLGANSLVPDAYLPVSTWKSKSVRAVMTSNVNLASPGATLDGLTMTAGDRVLLTAQTDLGAPGVYVWNSATTAMTRATDADAAAELCESIWVVAEGTQAHSVWMNTNKTIPTLGSTLLTFVRILDPGWTNPLTTSGDLLIAVTGGAASRLAAGANGLVLTMVAGLPKWSELSVSGMTNPMTDQGDIVYGGVNGVPTRLARGVAAQVLTVSNGGAPYWVAPTTGFANPMQDGGDLILGGSGGTATRLAAGSNGQVLTMVSGAVQWAAGGLTNPMTTHGDLLWGTDSGVPRRLGLGANGQVLTVVSGGLQWAAPTTGFANPMYFPGDLILGGTNGEGTRLAPGTTGQVLTITTEGPRWAGASGLTNPMTTVGDLIVGGTSGAAGRMSVGANGQVLTVVSGVPTWTAPSSGFSNPMTTAGDLIYGSTGGAGARLAAGTENQVLSMKSGFPTWVTGGGSYSDPMTTPGDMLVRGASATQRLAKGANGQVLTMVAGAPAWAAAGGGGGGMSNPMTALGQIIVSTDLEGTPGALDLGAEGQVLTVANGAPAWVDASGGTGGGELVITAPNAINFAAPSSTDYTGETLPYLRSDLNQVVGNYHEASVPATPGATYKWEIEGNLTPGLIGPNVFPVVQGTPANVLQFSAMVHTSIRIKCTKTSPTGLVEHAERVVAVNHRGRKLLSGYEAWGLSYMQTNVFGANDGVVGALGVSLFVGTTGAVVYPSQSVYNGTLYMVDGSCIRTLSDDRKHLATLAGQGWQRGYVDGAAADAQFGYPVELVWDTWHDNLLVVDQEPDGQMPYHIRRIDAATGAVSTVNHWTSWLDVNGNPQGNPLLPDAIYQLISICYRANRFWILVSVRNSPNTWAIWTGADVGGNNVLQQIYVGVMNPGTTEGFPSKIRITADDGLYLLFPTKVKVVNGNHMTPSGTSVSDFAGFISEGLSQEEHNRIGYMNDKVNDPGNLWDGKALIQNATDMVVSHDPADTVDSLYLTDNGCIRKVNMVSTNHELVTLSTQHGQNWLTSQLAVRQDATGFILVADQIFELTDDTWITAPLPENLPTLPALQQGGSEDFGVVQISESAPLIVHKLFGVPFRGRAAFYTMDVIPGSRWGVDIKTPNHNFPPLVEVLDSVTGASFGQDDFSDPDVEMAHIKVSQVSNIEAAGRLYVRILLLAPEPRTWDAVHGVWIDVPCPPTIIPMLYGGVTNPGGLTNPMTALGDLITAGASGVPQRLGVGAEGQVLKVVSGNPAWAAESGGSGGGHGEVIQEVAGTSVGTPITSCVARITPHAVGNRIHITTNAGSFRPTTTGRICISLQVNGSPVDQFTVVGSPTDLIGFPAFEFTGHAQSLDEVLITLSGVGSEVWFSDNVPINVEELDDSQMPLNIATVPRIEFAEPDANQASYYSGDVFPYLNPWTGSRQGSQWLASVPSLPGATYKWEVLGGTDIQMDYMSEVMFTARAGVSISLKCTRTASDGKVEVATAKIPVYYRAMHVEPINPNATKVWPGQVVDGVMGNPEVGFLDATMAMIPDGSGGIIFGDWGAIRRISADRSTLSLIAGAGSTNGQTGYAEGTGSAALLADEIHAIVRDVSGNGLFFSELTNHRIRTVDTVTGTTQNYIGTGSAVGVFPAGAIPIAEAVVNAPWAMAAVTDRFFFIDQDDNGRVLRYAHKSGEMQNVVVETLFNPSVNFGDFDTMTAVAAHVDGEGYVHVYVAFQDAVVLVGANNVGTVIAGKASMLRSAQDFYNYGAMHDYVNTTAPACFCNIRSMQWVGGDNGYLVVNDAGTIRTVSPSASVATRVKTLCVALAQQSWATSPAFLFTPNPNDETLPTVIMGGFDSPPWVESPGLVLGPYVGEDGMPQAADMAKAYDVGACLAIDETCPRYTHGTVRGRMATMGWVTREAEMWHVDFYTPYTSADTYGGRVEQGSGSPVIAQMVGYTNGIDNYAHRTITQTQRVADAGVFMPVVLTVERNGGWPAPAFIYGLQVGSTASSGVASTPPWVPATVSLFDALGRIKRIYQREGDASVDYTFNYQGLSSGITRIMVRGAGGLERIRVDGAGYRATGLTPVPSDSTVALDDYIVDNPGNVI